MSEDDPTGTGPSSGDLPDRASADASPADGAAAGRSTDAAPVDAGKEISAKLELLGAAALLSVTAAVRALESRGGPAPPEKRKELAELRRKLQTSMAALDENVAQGGIPGIDLTGLREKVAQALDTLDRAAGTLETPPS